MGSSESTLTSSQGKNLDDEITTVSERTVVGDPILEKLKSVKITVPILTSAPGVNKLLKTFVTGSKVAIGQAHRGFYPSRYIRFGNREDGSNNDSSSDADEPPPYWILLMEENLERRFDDLRLKFKKLGDEVKLIQDRDKQPMKPDWVLQCYEGLEKQFEKFQSNYKNFKYRNHQITALKSKYGMQFMAEGLSDIKELPPPTDLTLKKFNEQWADFGRNITESKATTSRIESTISAIEVEMKLMAMKYSSLINNKSTPDTIKDIKKLMDVLKGLYQTLAKSILEHPEEHCRFYEKWRVPTQRLISVIAFVHWMEDRNLILKTTVEKNVGFEPLLDLDDYLFGLCFMSDGMVKYASNKCDSLQDILVFMKHLEDTLGVLVLSNGELRRKFDGMKHNITEVERMCAHARKGNWILSISK